MLQSIIEELAAKKMVAYRGKLKECLLRRTVEGLPLEIIKSFLEDVTGRLPPDINKRLRVAEDY